MKTLKKQFVIIYSEKKIIQKIKTNIETNLPDDVLVEEFETLEALEDFISENKLIEDENLTR